MAAYTWKNRLLFTCTLILFSVISGWIFLFLHTQQPTPYMDEVFHVSQAQKYCEGKFDEWNSKITTLPGLYLISVGILRPLTFITGYNFCSVFYLRATNVLFSIGNLYLLYGIINKLHSVNKDFSHIKACLLAFNLALFPVLYFFTFLYYTDVASCFFVLLMYLFHLHGHSVMAATIGLLAVVMRQTNIVWVVFLAILTALNIIVLHLRIDKKDSKVEVKISHRFLVVIIREFVNMILHHRKRVPYLFWDLLEECCGYLFVCGLFAVFLHLNQGIAVGDKDAHEVCLHTPQLLYFLAFTLLFAFPYFINSNKLTAFKRSLTKKPIIFIAFTLAALLAVSYNTHFHLYNLSDNRHYTFYVMRKILRFHQLSRYILIPIYIFAGWVVMQTFHNKDIVWKLSLVICVVASLVPQKLLEFRYFILPYLLIRLNMPVDNINKLLLELLTYSAVNFYTLYMYVAKPFHWDDSTEVQRFIW